MCFPCKNLTNVEKNEVLIDNQMHPTTMEDKGNCQLQVEKNSNKTNNVETNSCKRKMSTTAVGSKNHENQPKVPTNIKHESYAFQESRVHFPIRPRTVKSSNAMLKGIRKELLKNAF